MTHTVRAMDARDYPAVRALWERSPGVGLNEADTPEAFAAFLLRNPGLSAVAGMEGAVVGALLCGHDGRRGYLHHLAVDAPQRGRGIARHLVAHCLERLAAAGVVKCNVYVFDDNEAGAAFWRHLGFARRDDFGVFQRATGPDPGPGAPRGK